MSQNNELIKNIIKYAGGAKNIKSVTNCATRLRMYIKDGSKFNEEEMKNVKGVLGFSLAGDQYQVIVGPSAIHLCREMQESYGVAGANNKEAKKTSGNIVNKFLETISGCIAPVVPALAAAGFIKVILVLCTMTGLLVDTSQTYQLLNVASDSVFYFMPIILAYTSAKRFQCNEVLAIVIAGILLHPTFTTLVTTLQESGHALRYLGLPVTLTSYNGTVVPIILTIWVMSYVEKLIDKILPEVVIHLFRPLLIVLFMIPIALVVTGPIGVVIGGGVTAVLTGIFAKAGWLALAISLIFAPFICMTGMHLAMMPIAMTSIAERGYDEFVLVMFLCFTLSQGAVALAVLIKSKSMNLRQLAIPAALSGLFGGTSEPALYGISVKMKRPLYASTIGSTIAGIYAGIVHLKVFSFGLFSLLGMPGYQSAKYTSNLQHALITAAIAVIGTMVAVWILGFDDSVYEDEDKDEEELTSDNKNGKVEAKDLQTVNIKSAVNGKLIKMKDINDSVFSAGVVGEAFGGISDDGLCYSPVNGKITTIFQTKHALGIQTEEGVEVLIHVGIDSVNLEGKGFELFVKEGDNVKEGQKLLSYSKELFKEKGIDETTIVVVSNVDDLEKVEMVCNDHEVKIGTTIMEVAV